MLALVAAGCTGADGQASRPVVPGSFEQPTRSGLRYPVRVAAGPDGTVYVSDSPDHRVIGYRDQRKIVQLGGLDQPLGIAVAGDLLYVGNVGRRDVEVYDLRTQRYLRALGRGAGEVSMPNAIAVAPDGVVYVVDSRERVVKVYGRDGTRTGTLGGLRYPIAVAVDADHVFVGDQDQHRVQVFDRAGTWQRGIGAEAPTEAASLADMRGRFTRIQGVALKDGDLYVLDASHGHVQVLDATGASKAFLGQVGDCPSCVRLALDVAVTPDGTLLVTDPEHRRWVTPTEGAP
jgi:DNA-binding beta-propeller fold protein YncE